VALKDEVSVERFFETVAIVLVGKYTDFADSYMSVTKALEHAAFRCRRKLSIQVGSSVALQPLASSILTQPALTVGRVVRPRAGEPRRVPGKIP
jgi:CTP synthase (UTP-ammonia lyase)